MREVKRGDIYYADLNPIMGCEQGGIRPFSKEVLGGARLEPPRCGSAKTILETNIAQP